MTRAGQKTRGRRARIRQESAQPRISGELGCRRDLSRYPWLKDKLLKRRKIWRIPNSVIIGGSDVGVGGCKDACKKKKREKEVLFLLFFVDVPFYGKSECSLARAARDDDVCVFLGGNEEEGDGVILGGRRRKEEMSIAEGGEGGGGSKGGRGGIFLLREIPQPRNGAFREKKSQHCQIKSKLDKRSNRKSKEIPNERSICPA